MHPDGANPGQVPPSKLVMVRNRTPPCLCFGNGVRRVEVPAVRGVRRGGDLLFASRAISIAIFPPSTEPISLSVNRGMGTVPPPRLASRSVMRHVPRSRTPKQGEPSQWPVPRSVWGLLSPRWIRALRALPVAVEPSPHGPVLVVAMADPGDLAAIDHVAFATGLRVKVLPSTLEERGQALDAHASPGGAPPARRA